MKIRNSVLLLITALIWGVAFVAQSEGGDAVGPLSFNCIRSLIGGMVLIPVIYVLDALKLSKGKPKDKQEQRKLWTGGIACGMILFMASTLQQLGLSYGTEAGKAGFLTACYILLVPLCGLFMKKTCGANVWVAVVLTLVGLYLLCINGKISVAVSDLFVLACAGVFTGHILVVDHFSPMVDGVRMSCIQFWVCGIIGVIPTVIFEMKPWSDLQVWAHSFSNMQAWIAILYAGVCSCGIAYTLQIVGQNGLNPTIASLLMSLESVFSVLAGWVILGEQLSKAELIGCTLIFVAIVLAQLPVGNIASIRKFYNNILNMCYNKPKKH